MVIVSLLWQFDFARIGYSPGFLLQKLWAKSRRLVGQCGGGQIILDSKIRSATWARHLQIPSFK